MTNISVVVGNPLPGFNLCWPLMLAEICDINVVEVSKLNTLKVLKLMPKLISIIPTALQKNCALCPVPFDKALLGSKTCSSKGFQVIFRIVCCVIRVVLEIWARAAPI